jgi:hypothetical protein
VPPEIAWEHFFQDMVITGFDKPEDAEPRAGIVEALSKYNLFIPEAQVRTVLLVSKATIAKVDDLKRPLDPEGNGKNRPGLTKAEREAAIAGAATAVLAGRDQLVQLLPRKDMAAVDRYVVTKIIPSIRVSFKSSFRVPVTKAHLAPRPRSSRWGETHRWPRLTAERETLA